MKGSFNHEALWIKAKLFINRAMDSDPPRTFDEKALWAALALELLGKAALSRMHPALIAEPTEEGQNILVASGLVKGDAKFTSVRAKTIFARCQKAFRPFDANEAGKITGARNEYLHGGGVAFTSIPENAWWASFWAQASILISALDKEVEDFVGPTRESIVNVHLAQNKKNVEHRTEALIERAKQRLTQQQSGALTTKVAAEVPSGYKIFLDLDYSSLHECPACHSNGFLEGVNVSDTYVDRFPEDDGTYDSFVTLTIDAEYFSCSTCHLALEGYELISQAGLPTTFDVEGDLTDIYDEPDYGND